MSTSPYTSSNLQKRSRTENESNDTNASPPLKKKKLNNDENNITNASVLVEPNQQTLIYSEFCTYLEVNNNGMIDKYNLNEKYFNIIYNLSNDYLSTKLTKDYDINIAIKLVSDILSFKIKQKEEELNKQKEFNKQKEEFNRQKEEFDRQKTIDSYTKQIIQNKQVSNNILQLYNMLKSNYKIPTNTLKVYLDKYKITYKDMDLSKLGPFTDAKSNWINKTSIIQKDNLDHIPMKENGCLDFMSFPFQQNITWESKTDSTLKNLCFTGKSRIIYFLAPTSTGKTSSMQRILISNFGLFFSCVHINEFTGSSRDYLTRGLHKSLTELSQSELFAFGYQYTILMFIAKIYHLLQVVEYHKLQKITPAMFLVWQLNGNTSQSYYIYLDLIKENYMYLPMEELNFILELYYKSLCEKLKVKKLPFFIDEVQIFASGNSDCLSNNYTATSYNTPRKNDIFSLFLAIHRDVLDPLDNTLIVIGTGFSASQYQILSSYGASKDKFSLISLIGQELINSKDKLLEYISILITIPQELKKFINSPLIYFHLPMRRRVLANICYEIVRIYTDTQPLSFNDYHNIFCSVLTTTAKNLHGYVQQRFTNNIQSFSKFLALLKLSLISNTSAVLPATWFDDLQDNLIASGIVNYSINEFWNYDEKLDCSQIIFNLKEPIYLQILNLLDSNNDTLNYLLDISCSKVESGSNKQLEYAFGILLAIFTKKKIKFKDMELLKNKKGTQLDLSKFSESRKYLIINDIVQEINLKNYLFHKIISISNLENHQMIKDKVFNLFHQFTNNDFIYWSIIDDNELRFLMENIIYMPSSNAHPDLLLFTKINDNEYGIISIAIKYLTTKKENKFKQTHLQNTFQSLVSSIYTTKTFTFGMKTFPTNLQITYSKENNKLTLDKNYVQWHTIANKYPNLPITVTLNSQYTNIHDITKKYAIHITSANLDNFFGGKYLQKFKELNEILNSN